MVVDVPWSVWGGEFSTSTEVSVGTVAQYNRGLFKLVFPPSDETKPMNVRWHHLLGEEPYNGSMLRVRQPRAAPSSHGSGLPVGARQFIDRMPHKARRNPLPQPYRVLAYTAGRAANHWIGHVPPSIDLDKVEADLAPPSTSHRDTFRELLHEDTITCWTKGEVDHPVNFFEQVTADVSHTRLRHRSRPSHVMLHTGAFSLAPHGSPPDSLASRRSYSASIAVRSASARRPTPSAVAVASCSSIQRRRCQTICFN